MHEGILLDTHTWFWLNNGSPELTAKSIKVIDHAASQGKVFVSVISIWELGTLITKKRITMRTPVTQWVNEALSQTGVNLLVLTPDIAIESTQLPNEPHGDPADRILIASARLHHLTILTRDSKILAYAKSGSLKAMEV